MNDDIDNALMETDNDFTGEVFLSTDGKHTVHVKASTKEGRKAALNWAKLVYEGIKSNYGTKQELNKTTYNEKEELGNCPKCGAPNAKSLKTGKPYCSAKCWLKES